MSMAPFPRFKYVDTALPTGANTVVLLATAPPSAGVAGAFTFGNGFQMLGIHRILVALTNSQAGTLKAYQSLDRGATWVRIVPDTAVAAAAANSENIYDFLVEPYADWKVEWTNGGVDQTVFRVNIIGEGQRVIAN
jgi:hypothetical protein